jgi:hypothetical protein
LDLICHLQAHLHAHMRQKTNQLLRRIQAVRPEVKKNYRRGAANAAGKFNEKQNSSF